MDEKVKTIYFNDEMQDPEFNETWSSAAECANQKPDPEDKALTTDHMQAICVYTCNDLYEQFNTAVRTQGPNYNTTFKYRSLHFYLTSAIQILNSKKNCSTTYRRTTSSFTGIENSIIRFGAFASSSFKKDLIHFGNKTCFKIKTCLGAYLKHYSSFCTAEEEVLIPPCEKFKVTKKVVGPGEYKGLEDCEVVFELENVGYNSTLNCRNIKPDPVVGSALGLRGMFPSLNFLVLVTLSPYFCFMFF